MENQNPDPNTEPVPAVKLDWNKFILPGSILIAAILISGALLYVNNGNQGAGLGQKVGSSSGAKVEVSADDDPFLGSAKAKVSVIEFSDFQCPFCRRFWKETLPQIKKEYIDTGKIKFVYRDFPLSFHAGAQAAAEGAECAEEQGKFWEMHDKIFQGQDLKGQGTVDFNISDVKKWAAATGVDTAKFNQCLDSGKYSSEVAKDQSDGLAAGVEGTPTIFVNGKPIVGAQPFSAFKVIIDQELQKAK